MKKLLLLMITIILLTNCNRPNNHPLIDDKTDLINHLYDVLTEDIHNAYENRLISSIEHYYFCNYVLELVLLHVKNGSDEFEELKAEVDKSFKTLIK